MVDGGGTVVDTDGWVGIATLFLSLVSPLRSAKNSTRPIAHSAITTPATTRGREHELLALAGALRAPDRIGGPAREHQGDDRADERDDDADDGPDQRGDRERLGARLGPPTSGPGSRRPRSRWAPARVRPAPPRCRRDSRGVPEPSGNVTDGSPPRGGTRAIGGITVERAPSLSVGFVPDGDPVRQRRAPRHRRRRGRRAARIRCVRAPARHAARPAGADGVGVPRPGDAARPPRRHARRREDRGDEPRRPRAVFRDEARAAPLPGIDGEARARARDPHRRALRRRRRRDLDHRTRRRASSTRASARSRASATTRRRSSSPSSASASASRPKGGRSTRSRSPTRGRVRSPTSTRPRP